MWGPRWFCDWCYQTFKLECTDNLCTFFPREKWGGWGVSHSFSEGWALQPTPQTTANMARAALLGDHRLLYTPSMLKHILCNSPDNDLKTNPITIADKADTFQKKKKKPNWILASLWKPELLSCYLKPHTGSPTHRYECIYVWWSQVTGFAFILIFLALILLNIHAKH